MENKNMFETFADMQKQAAESFTTAAENMQKTIQNGGVVDFNSDVFKKWYESQMAWFNQNQGENKNTQAFEFFNNWMTKQMEMAKNWQDNSQNVFKGMPNLAGMPNMNFGHDMNSMMNLFNSWKDTMSTSYSEMLKNFNNGTSKDSFSGLINNAEMYMKMFEFMMPVMKGLQDKTYTPDMFKQMFNTEIFKGLMDKMFNMQPDFMKNMMNDMNSNLKNNMFNMMDSNKSAFDNMKNMMNNQMSSMMPNDMFGTAHQYYNNFMNQMNNSFAPLAKLMPKNNNTAQMDAMKEISNLMAAYNMKNSQLQYMMYTTGLKAMDTLSENLYSKMRNGEEMSNFTNVYQEWLNTNDKQFVALFETEDYSKLMSEVSALQMNLKKSIETQMEKSMSHLPLINRTEMDELYKTVYEMKKRINMLEKQIDNDVVVSEEPKAAKKTSKNA